MANYETKFKTGLSALCFFAATTAMAGTVFMPPPSNGRDQAENTDEYPESHFGNTIQKGFAAHEVTDMETPDEENGRTPGRGIASVGGSPNAGAMIGDSTESSIVTSQAQDIPASVVARRGVQEVSVIASDLGYFPKTIFVSRDVPVRLYITSASKNTLCIMMDSFQVRKQIKTQKIEEITFVPSVPGKYRFYCPVNGMEGSLVVKEFSSSVPMADEGTPVQQQGQPQPVAGNPTYNRGPSGATSVPSVASEWNSAIGK